MVTTHMIKHVMMLSAEGNQYNHRNIISLSGMANKILHTSSPGPFPGFQIKQESLAHDGERRHVMSMGR